MMAGVEYMQAEGAQQLGHLPFDSRTVMAAAGGRGRSDVLDPNG
jgi:hypothetical protein